ncbi:MAG: hypothetical protein M3Y59_12220 [Myxococcota bacterium]|nr:hypothetical protein [Myxococcota bacterium]
MNSRREQIEKTADRIRDELLITLQELDRRRTEATDVGLQLKKHSTGATLIGVGLLAALGGAFAWTAHRARSMERRKRQRRYQALSRAWKHPERLAVRSEDRALPVELGKKLGLALGLAFGTQLAKRTAELLIPAVIARKPLANRR